MVYAFLTNGRYAGCDGTLYRWMANPGGEIYVGMLKKPDHMASITAALTDAAGVESRFEPVVPGAAQTGGDSEASLLAELENTFGKANTLVQDDAK